jgi:signal transduction histidine kinase
MKLNFFTKILGLLIVAVLLFFGLQFVVRNLYFQDLYINRVIDRNVALIEEVRDRVFEGESVSYILDDLEVTEIQVIDYVEEEEVGYFFSSYQFDLEDVDDIEDFYDIDYLYDEYLVSDDVLYMVVEDEFGYGNSTYHIYAIEIEDGYYLLFEQYLTGLVDANYVLTSIDLYILLIVLIVFIPISVWFSSNMSRPLKRMKNQARELANLEFNEPLNIRTNDEIEELSRSMNLVSMRLKNAISELKDDIEKERIKDKKNRELIASLSHELKTPLTTMRGVVEGMLDNVGVYKDKETYLKETLKHLSFMEYLSKDLIDVIGYETKTIHKLLRNFSDVLEDALDYVDADQVSLEIEDAAVLCNQEMLQRVLINLISNGIKYSPNNKVTVRTKREDQFIVQIINDGEIQDSELEKVFEPFYRVEKSRNKTTGGSGLGLFIVKSILDNHNSAYSLNSENGKVVFSFTLDTDTTLTKV